MIYNVVPMPRGPTNGILDSGDAPILLAEPPYDRSPLERHGNSLLAEQEGKSRGDGRFVIAGPLRGDLDQDSAPIIETSPATTVETTTEFCLLLWGAHNLLIRRYSLGVFRFA